jgi:hypothetical protein
VPAASATALARGREEEVAAPGVCATLPAVIVHSTEEARLRERIAAHVRRLFIEGKHASAAELSRLALTDRAWFGETDRDLGVIGVGELSMCGQRGLVRPS